MSESTTTTTASTVANEIKTRFDGDGIPFKAKLIGMEDLSLDRDEKLCLDSMFKLKAVVIARGEHKQKIQLNLTLNGIRVYDDATKVLIASHEINRVTYVVMDPRDPRAFGYNYITTDNRIQFWAIKTERTAATTVLAFKELFELAVERLKNSGTTEEQVNQTTSVPASPEDISVSIQKSPTESIPVSTPPPPPPKSVLQPATSSTDNIWGDNPSTIVPRPSSPPQLQPPPKPVPQPATSSTDNIWGDNASTIVPRPSSPPQLQPPPKPVPQPATSSTDNIWGDSPSTIAPRPSQTPQQQQQQQPPPKPDIDLWDFNEPVVPVIKPSPPPRVDPLADIFDLLTPSPTAITTNQKPTSTASNDDLLSMFSTPTPTPTVNTNFSAQPIQQTSFFPQQYPVLSPLPTPTVNTNFSAQPIQQTPLFPQQYPVLSPPPLVPRQQQNFLGSSVSPSPKPKNTTATPFDEFNLLGDFYSGPTTGTTTK